MDSYNAVSLRHGLPAGAFDLARVSGDVDIRYADGSERFTPLGEPDTVENPKPGEIIYADAHGVLTRHWNHRDAHRTRVTEDSTQVTFVLETLHAHRDGHLLEAAAKELQALLLPHADHCTVRYLDPMRPRRGRLTTSGAHRRDLLRRGTGWACDVNPGARGGRGRAAGSRRALAAGESPERQCEASQSA